MGVRQGFMCKKFVKIKITIQVACDTVQKRAKYELIKAKSV